MAANLAHLTTRMRQGETISTRDTIQIVATLSVPCIIEQLVITAMQYIDAAMVGHLGANATASIGVVSSTTWLFNGLMFGLSTAFSVQIAQYLGARREQEARNVFRQAVLYNIFFGCFLACVGLSISQFLPIWLGADVSIQSTASTYFAIWSLALPLHLGQGLYSAILRCSGDTRTPSFLNALMCPLDIFFNFFLINSTRTISLLGVQFTIWGAGLGVAGAAIGTAIATSIVCLLMLYTVLTRNTPLQYKRGGSWKITRTCLQNLRTVGVPISCERLALSTAQVMLVKIVATLGTVSIAANSLSINAEAFCYLPGNGVQAATIALVGQAIGAGRKDIAKRFAWICTATGTGIMTISTFFLYLFAPHLMAMFTPDAQVIALGTTVLRIVAFVEPFFGASIVASGAMRGAGDSRAPFFINLISMWGIRISLAFLLAPHYGLVGIWVAMAIELSFRGIVFLLRLASGRWLRKDALQ